MKKLAIFILAAIVAVSSSAAVKIAFDKVQDGGRLISVEQKTFRNGMTDKFPLNISVGAVIVKGGNASYGITLMIKDIAGGTKVEPNSTLIIKTGSGQVIEGKTSIAYSDELGKFDTFSKVRYYTISPNFEVSLDDLNAIAKDGIVKIRMQCTDGYKESEIKDKNSKKIAVYFQEALKVLDDAIKSGANAKDIHDGF